MKKTFILLLFSLVVLFRSNAQDSTDRGACLSNTFCNFGSLEQQHFTNVLMVPNKIYYGKNPEPASFGDVFYQLNQCKTPQCPLDLTLSDDCIHTQDALYYYVFYPADYGQQNYIECPLPGNALNVVSCRNPTKLHRMSITRSDNVSPGGLQRVQFS